jgi:type IV pilus assembly PilX-like protein
MSRPNPIDSQGGAALVIAVMAMTLMLALGSALILLSTSETAIAANFRASHESFYAADAAIERALVDLRNIPDWTPVLNGTIKSTFVDGPSSGVRTLPDGSRIDLGQIVNLANCQHSALCSPAEIAAVTQERPWGANNPNWTPFSHGALERLTSGTVHSSFYMITLVGDDPSENDNDPAQDGMELGGQGNPGLGVLALRAEAFGPRAAHHVVEATIARSSTELRILSWREVQ